MNEQQRAELVRAKIILSGVTGQDEHDEDGIRDAYRALCRVLDQQGSEPVQALRLAAQPAPVQEPVGTVKDLFTQAAWEKLDVRGSTKVHLATPPAAQPAPVQVSIEMVPDPVATLHPELYKATWEAMHGPAPLAVMKPNKENPYYPATYIGEGWQDGFDGKALASTLEPYTRGYAEGKADAHAIKQTQGITKGQP